MCVRRLSSSCCGDNREQEINRYRGESEESLFLDSRNILVSDGLAERLEGSPDVSLFLCDGADRVTRPAGVKEGRTSRAREKKTFQSERQGGFRSGQALTFRHAVCSFVMLGVLNNHRMVSCVSL